MDHSPDWNPTKFFSRVRHLYIKTSQCTCKSVYVCNWIICFRQIIRGGQGTRGIGSSAHPLPHSCSRGTATIRSLSNLGRPGASSSSQARTSLLAQTPASVYPCDFCLYANVNVVLQTPGGSKRDSSSNCPIESTVTWGAQWKTWERLVLASYITS